MFVLNSGSASDGVFVWVGKQTTAEEKKGGMRLATTFLEQTHQPVATTPVTRVMEGGETALFISFFAEWHKPVAANFGFQESRGVAASTSTAAAEGDALDLSRAMLEERVQKEESAVEEEGTGSLKVWRVENMDKVEVSPAQVGHFYSGDSYLVRLCVCVFGGGGGGG